jgi:putative spermidine/putrescine transport system ATP-binding protein
MGAARLEPASRIGDLADLRKTSIGQTRRDPGAATMAAPMTASAASADPFVRFTDVEKTYDGESLVVKSLSLDVRRGEFLTLLGPSGSGKTTTLMMVAGFESPTRGDILLDGVSIKGLPPHKRGIGMVFQDYALFPHMTVRQNLAFPLEVRQTTKADIGKRVERVLDMVQLGGFSNRRPGQLSGGQKQRVALARALVFEPSLVLMDEPLGALDRQLREAMQYEIKHIHESLGVTVIYVTHDQGEALTMSDRIAVFDQGIIQQLATPDQLYEKPENAFVAQFIGENNRLSGRVLAVDGDICTVEIAGGTVRALAVNMAGVGSTTTLSLRPERVTLNPRNGTLVNQFDGVVRELIYLGDHIRTRIAVCGHEDFVVKVPNAADHEGIAVGENVRVGWRPEDCRALDGL